MNLPRLLFDECIGKPLVDRLARFVAESSEFSPEIQHILEFQQQGVRDEEWIPRVAQENWVLITQDRGAKGTRKGERLPKLCVEFGITHVVLSRRIAGRKSFEKTLAILSVWGEILALVDVAPGSRFVIEPYVSQNRQLTAGRLLERTPGRDGPGQPPTSPRGAAE